MMDTDLSLMFKIDLVVAQKKILREKQTEKLEMLKKKKPLIE